MLPVGCESSYQSLRHDSEASNGEKRKKQTLNGAQVMIPSSVARRGLGKYLSHPFDCVGLHALQFLMARKFTSELYSSSCHMSLLSLNVLSVVTPDQHYAKNIHVLEKNRSFFS